MKKIFLVFLLLFSLSACSNGKSTGKISNPLNYNNYSQTKGTLCAIGDSIINFDEIGTTTTHTYYKEGGVLRWANDFLYQRFDILNVNGLSGEGTAEVLAALQTSVIDYNPDYCIVGGTINDVTGGVSSTTIMSNLGQTIDNLKAAGIIPIVLTVPPSSNVDSASENEVWHTVNRWIIDNSYTDGYYVFNWGEVYTDASGTYPAPITAYVDGTVHQKARLAYFLGKELSAFLDTIYPVEKKEQFLSNSDPKSYLANPLMLGTGGTASTNTTGDVADSWTVTCTNCIATTTKESRSDYPGDWQKIEAGVATADGADARMYQVGATGDAANYIGTDVYGLAEIKIGSGVTSPDSVYISVEARNNTSGIIYTVSDKYHPSADDEIDTYAEGDTFMLKTPVMTVPENSWTLRLFIHLKLDTGGYGNYYVGQAGIITE